MKLFLCTSLFNSSDNLEIFLQNIENQVYNDWELLICDDCSEDSTLKILKKKKDEYLGRLHIIENNINIGLTRSLINLINNVPENGHIVRLDDDEIHCSEYLLSIADSFQKGHDLIIYTDYPLIANILLRIHKYNKLFASIFLSLIGNIGTHGGTSFTKKLYKKSGGYSKAFYLSQDYHLLIRLIKFSKKPLFIYRKNFKPFDIPRQKYKISINESLLQKVFSLISLIALFKNKNKNFYFPFFIILLILSIPIKLIRSLIFKFIRH